MNVSETKEILRLVFGAYPTQRQRMQADDVGAMLNVWSLGLADIPFEQAKAAIGRLVCTSKWMPSIAEVRAELGNLHHGRKRHGIDAWGDVKALREPYRDREAMAEVDPLVLHVCQSFEWIQWRTLWRNGEDVEQWHVVHSDNETADRARFVEAYDKLTSDERQVAQISAGAKIPASLNRRRDHAQLGDIVNGLLPEKVEP